MNFPEQVTFKLIDKRTKRPVKNIAISLILYAHKKNDYYVGPKISDKEGIIYFKREECIKEIESSRSFYLMDYLSTLEQCLPKISIKIKPKEELKFAVKNMRQCRDIYRDYWDYSEEFLKQLEAVNNAFYQSKIYNFSESDLWQNKILEIELEKKSLPKKYQDLSVLIGIIVGTIVVNYKHLTFKSFIFSLVMSFSILSLLGLFFIHTKIGRKIDRSTTRATYDRLFKPDFDA